MPKSEIREVQRPTSEGRRKVRRRCAEPGCVHRCRVGELWRAAEGRPKKAAGAGYGRLRLITVNYGQLRPITVFEGVGVGGTLPLK
jgi:hypothetical protein